MSEHTKEATVSRRKWAAIAAAVVVAILLVAVVVFYFSDTLFGRSEQVATSNPSTGAQSAVSEVESGGEAEAGPEFPNPERLSEYIELPNPQDGESYCELLTNYINFGNLVETLNPEQVDVDRAEIFDKMYKTAQALGQQAEDPGEAAQWDELVGALKELSAISSAPGSVERFAQYDDESDPELGAALLKYATSNVDLFLANADSMQGRCNISELFE